MKCKSYSSSINKANYNYLVLLCSMATQMLEAAERSLVEARRAAVATAERGDRLSAERDAAMRQVAALQAALAGESSINPPNTSLQPMQSE